MRTVVISDLHLGVSGERDVLRRAGPLQDLCEFLAGADRLVLLGDIVEFRHGPAREALAAAEPVMRALGAALGPGAEVIIVPGNHDHALLAPWLERRARDAPAPPLGLETRAGADAGEAVAKLALWLGRRRKAGPSVDIAYPGLWLREDVYATHGHYLDRFLAMPTFERIAAGAMVRFVGPVPQRARAEDFEAALAPMYAWLHAVAQQAGAPALDDSDDGPVGNEAHVNASTSTRAWTSLTGGSRRSWRARALGAALPLAVAGLNRAGLGPLRSDVSGAALRDAGLEAMGEVVRRLGIGAPHVIFGHTHRAGPLPGDDIFTWTAPATGARLHNCGSWVEQPWFSRDDPQSPYWAGRAVVVEGHEPPRLERVVENLGPGNRLRS